MKNIRMNGNSERGTFVTTLQSSIDTSNFTSNRLIQISGIWRDFPQLSICY